MKDTCFVIMPYGVKQDIDGNDINFDDIYDRLIKDAVNGIDGLDCQRCDDIEKPGWVHERMLKHIAEDRVAIVDTSTLNANVFYELGVRHALRKSITILIHRKGTSWPFNIAGLSSIEYGTTPRGITAAKATIRRFIKNAMADAANVDSLVYHAVNDLRVTRGEGRPPKPITKFQTIEHRLRAVTAKRIGVVTGDREDITVGDVWVNSENTDMQMDRYFGASTSATIRYLGARKNAVTGRIEEDTIGEALARCVERGGAVGPATVIATEPGALAHQNVKWIFHVAAVIGQPRQGYKPVDGIERCVTNALKRAAMPEFRGDRLASMVLPLFGTGPGGGSVADHAGRLFDAAIDYFESNPKSPIEVAYFYVWSDIDLETCISILQSTDRLEKTPWRRKGSR